MTYVTVEVNLADIKTEDLQCELDSRNVSRICEDSEIDLAAQQLALGNIPFALHYIAQALAPLDRAFADLESIVARFYERKTP